MKLCCIISVSCLVLGGEFEVSKTGEVSTVTALDYEIKQYYELVFEVSDSGLPPLTTTTTLGITVTGTVIQF